jgi:hypothetical protein
MLRTSHDGDRFSIDGYSAGLSFASQGQVQFWLRRFDDGIGSGPLAASNDFIGVDFSTGVFHVRFEALGPELTASYWYVEEDSGFGTTETYLLTLNASDSRYSAGMPGLSAFARSTNSVFFDDIRASVPEPGTAALLLIGAISCTAMRR